MILGLLLIALFLFALKDCLCLDNSITSVYGGKINDVVYLNNGIDSPICMKQKELLDSFVSVGNTFDSLDVNKATKDINCTFEEEYLAYKCQNKPSRYSNFVAA